MKQIDPIISIVAMAVVAIIAAVFLNATIGIIIFAVLYAIGLLGDKIMGNIPNTHD